MRRACASSATRECWPSCPIRRGSRPRADTPSERVVLETLDRVIRDAKGQTLVATFASNISRVYMVLLAAEKCGKKVAVAGRSMEQNVRTALELGYLDPPEGVLLPLDDVLKLPSSSGCSS